MAYLYLRSERNIKQCTWCPKVTHKITQINIRGHITSFSLLHDWVHLCTMTNIGLYRNIQMKLLIWPPYDQTRIMHTKHTCTFLLKQKACLINCLHKGSFLDLKSLPTTVMGGSQASENWRKSREVSLSLSCSPGLDRTTALVWCHCSVVSDLSLLATSCSSLT